MLVHYFFYSGGFSLEEKKKLERDVALNIHMELGKSLAFTVKQVQEVLML